MEKKDYKIENGILTFENGRDTIESHEFFQAEITEAIVPEGVKEIGYWAFGGCRQLKKIVLPSTLEKISGEVFALCNLEDVVLTDGCPKLRDVSIYSFGYECTWITRCMEKNEYLMIGSVLLRYENKNNVETVSIPEGVEIISNGALCSGTMSEIIIPEGVTEIRSGAFSDCKQLAKISLPHSLKEIGKDAFVWCTSLRSITIPDGVTTLGNDIFQFCPSLEEVILPVTLKAIGSNLFCNIGFLPSACKNLKRIAGIIPAMFAGCKIHTDTALWLMDNVWKEGHLEEIVAVYLTQSRNKVVDKAAIMLSQFPEQAIEVMECYQKEYKLKAAGMKKLNEFVEVWR